MDNLSESVSAAKDVRPPLSDAVDKWLFFVALIAGAASILALKHFEVRQVITTGVPVAVIIVYALLASLSPRFRAREDKAAENCYYLGLLFTLVSLACALTAFSTDIASTESIITDFGVALATTITGLALRVLISQMREDPVEFEREARQELGSATARLTAELHIAVNNFGSFRRNMEQTLDETMTAAVQKTSTALADNVAKFAEVGTQVIGKIDASFETFNKQSERLNELTSQTIVALEALFCRIEAIDSSPDIVGKKLEPVIAGFRALIEEAQGRATSQNAEIKRLGKLASGGLETLDRATGAVKSMEATMTRGSQRLAKEMQAAADAMGKVQAAVAGLAGAAQTDVETLRKTGERMRQAIEGDFAAIQRRRADIEAEVDTAAEMVKRVHASLTSLADLVTESLDAKR